MAIMGKLRGGSSIFLIFTARCSNASAVLGVVILTVSPYITHVLCDETKEHTEL